MILGGVEQAWAAAGRDRECCSCGVRGVQLGDISDGADAHNGLRYRRGRLADGIEDGRAPLPSISYEKSMVDGIEALRAYEANIQAIDTTRSMIDSAIRVLA